MTPSIGSLLPTAPAIPITPVKDGKVCAKCRKLKSLSEFHWRLRSRNWKKNVCRSCTSASRKNPSREKMRQYNLKQKYRTTEKEVQSMLSSQNYCCGLCEKDIKETYRIDHNHNTNKVRGILCHRCNIRLGGWDDLKFREAALVYLGIVIEQNVHKAQIAMD